jgi:hypothetical protein
MGESEELKPDGMTEQGGWRLEEDDEQHDQQNQSE